MRRTWLPAILLVLATAASCGDVTRPAPSAGPGGPAPSAGTASPDPTAWSAADVHNPDIVTQAPSLEPGYQCSPCHPAAASQLFGIGGTGTDLVAVGVQQPPAVAIAFVSHDGRRWDADPGWSPLAGSTAIAVAAAGGRTVVVGSGPTGAMAWTRTAAGWTAAAPAGLAGLPGATAMTSVTAWSGGFLAGGFRDDPGHARAFAAAWRSADGLDWQMDDATDIFAGGRIQGVAARGSTLVAVGSSGDPSYGPAAAWVSTDGTWRRARIPDAGGVMRAVVATGTGFVAVGQDGDDAGARVWRSSDGEAWTLVADQAAFHHGAAPIRMQAVAADPALLVAGGWRADAGNGSVAAWTSVDGDTWTQDPWVPAFSGGQITGIVLAGGQAVGVGRSGYPDNNQAAAWAAPRP